MGTSRMDLVESAESTVPSGKRRLLAAALLGGVLARLPGAVEGVGATKRKPKRGRGRATPVRAEKKDGGGAGTVVIETGPTVVIEGPWDPNEPPFVAVLTSTAACTNGVAVGGGSQSVRPTPRISVSIQDSYPSSPTEWTVTAITDTTGHGFTPYVLCLV